VGALRGRARRGWGLGKRPQKIRAAAPRVRPFRPQPCAMNRPLAVVTGGQPPCGMASTLPIPCGPGETEWYSIQAQGKALIWPLNNSLPITPGIRTHAGIDQHHGGGVRPPARTLVADRQPRRGPRPVMNPPRQPPRSDHAHTATTPGPCTSSPPPRALVQRPPPVPTMQEARDGPFARHRIDGAAEHVRSHDHPPPPPPCRGYRRPDAVTIGS